MAPAGFEPATPASERPRTHAIDRAATGIGSQLTYEHYYMLFYIWLSS